jgi:hypothetical protein|nr:MAG TPA: hypothetical protein [Caudoviricetes sp.]
MDASRIYALTTQRLEDVTKAATAHRPIGLLDVTTGGGYVHVEAISADGRTVFGEWDLHLHKETMSLRVIVDDILYAETFEGSPYPHWDRVMNGLRSWGKAVNACELKTVLAGTPNLAHLSADHLMPPREYSPLGGRPQW